MINKVAMMRLKLILFILIILSSNSIYAISIGVSPGRVTFENLLRGGYAERSVRITTNSPEEITGHFEVNGEIAEWLKFEPNSTLFIVSSTQPYLLKIIISPPNDSRSDSYSGNINVITDRFGSPTGRAGGFVKAAVTLSLSAVVTDKEIISCRGGGFDFKDIEIGYPLEVSYTITNDGNVRIKPLVSFDIWDQEQENLLVSEEFASTEILPTAEQRFLREISGKELSIGQYWVNIAIDECKASSLVSFSVVEKGGIVDKGVLEKINNKPWAYVNEPIEIIATFKNEGPRIVSAKFKGNIKLEDKIVKVIETEEVDIGSGETADLKSYFTPVEPGRYVVTGRIVYNKKFTFEKGSIINVNAEPEGETKTKFSLLLIYLVILITIIFILRKIIRAKKGF